MAILGEGGGRLSLITPALPPYVKNANLNAAPNSRDRVNYQILLLKTTVSTGMSQQPRKETDRRTSDFPLKK